MNPGSGEGGLLLVLAIGGACAVGLFGGCYWSVKSIICLIRLGQFRQRNDWHTLKFVQLGSGAIIAGLSLYFGTQLASNHPDERRVLFVIAGTLTLVGTTISVRAFFTRLDLD